MICYVIRPEGALWKRAWIRFNFPKYELLYLHISNVISPYRDEIQALKSIKPNYAERRSLEETMAQAIKTGSEDEEKKIEETEMADSAAETKPLENDNNKNTEEADSVDSAASDEVIKEIVSIDDENMTNESENNDANVDTSSADSVSLFSRFLTITNKNGATSGTITLGEDDIDDENTDDDENQVIIPTIIQNGRPVSCIIDTLVHLYIMPCEILYSHRCVSKSQPKFVLHHKLGM